MNLVKLAPHFETTPSWFATLESKAPWINVVEEDVLPDSAIHGALVDEPNPGWSTRYPHLSLVLSLSAGVDVLLSDPSLPNIPIVRLVPPEMAALMSEYVAYHVLRIHRRFRDLENLQDQKLWVWQDASRPARMCRVSILGLGELGAASARTLAALGFDVAGWSRSEKQIEGVRTYSGSKGLASLLTDTDILVCLLPLTNETREILSTDLFARLPRGAAVINASRGRCLSESDLLRCLDTGHLSHATLDVFDTEPLPHNHEFWKHPRVTVTPHSAAFPSPEAFLPVIAAAVQCAQDSLVPPYLVDRVRGY